jgi:hypothetical protein
MTMNHFQLIVIKRIDDHKVAEAKRLEAERERIRAEEVARLEMEAKKKAEDDAIAFEKRERERLANETAAAQVPAQPVSGTPSEAQHPQPAPAAAPVDADTILLDFKERFGRDKRFAGVTRAILEYFKAQPKQRKAA